MTATINRNKYAKLLSDQLPRIIESDTEHQAMLSDIRQLMLRGDKLSNEELELLQLMTMLVENYESKRFQQVELDPLAVLEHLMDAHSHTAKDLWGVLADKGTVSKILNGERAISKAQARKLADFYHVSPGVFI